MEPDERGSDDQHTPREKARGSGKRRKPQGTSEVHGPDRHGQAGSNGTGPRMRPLEKEDKNENLRNTQRM